MSDVEGRRCSQPYARGAAAGRRHRQAVTAGNPAATDSPAGRLRGLREEKAAQGEPVWLGANPRSSFNKINVGMVGW